MEMTELTTEQNRLILIAKARRRRAEAEAGSPAAIVASDAPKPTFGQTMADVGTSVLSGLGKGTAEFTGDIISSFQGNAPFFRSPTQSANAVLANALAGLVPTKNKVVGSTLRAAVNPNAQTFAQMHGTITGALQPNNTLGEELRPQTTPGRFAETAAEFIPMGIAGGPGGVVRRVAESAALGLASEGGGQLAEGTPFEGAARIASPLILALLHKSPQAISEALKYGTKAPAAVEGVRGTALAELLAQQEAANKAANISGAQSAGSNYGAALNEAAAKVAAAKTTPKPFAEGRVTTLDERGQPIQADIVKAKENILQKRGEERAALEAPVIERVKAKESSGDFISDTDKAKKLLMESKRAVKTNVKKDPTATSAPTKEEAIVHNRIIDAFNNRLVRVPESYVETATAKGDKIIYKEVTDFKTGERVVRPFRQFKTSYEAVDNLRRRFGDAFHGKDVTGFEGISQNLIKDMYEKIRGIQKDYVGADLYEPLQTSYANFTKALAPFNETQIGKFISGTQGTTDIANLTPSQVPGAVLSKGAGGFEQVQALGGNPTKALADEVATAFHNPTTNAPKTAAEVRALLHNSDLGSAVNANPEIKAAVDRHLTQLNDAERMSVRAEEFKLAGKKATEKATKSAETSIKAKAEAENFQRQITALRNLPQKRVLPEAEKIINKYASISEQDRLLKEIRNAEKLYGEKGVRDFIKKSIAAGALGAVGLGGANAAIHKISIQ